MCLSVQSPFLASLQSVVGVDCDGGVCSLSQCAAAWRKMTSEDMEQVRFTDFLHAAIDVHRQDQLGPVDMYHHRAYDYQTNTREK